MLHPEKRIYPVAGMPTTEAAIDQGVFRDLYLVIGDPQDDGGYAVRSYIKPFANWIWGGALLMALGGCSQPVRPAVPGGGGGAARRRNASGGGMMRARSARAAAAGARLPLRCSRMKC